MTSFFDRFKGRKEPSSAELAKQRLQLVLVTDRSNLSPEKLEEMQAEIIKVIKRYVTIDDMEVRINFEQRDRKYHLVADIPLHRDSNYGAIEAPAPPPGDDSKAKESEDAESDSAEDVTPGAAETKAEADSSAEAAGKNSDSDSDSDKA